MFATVVDVCETAACLQECLRDKTVYAVFARQYPRLGPSLRRNAMLVAQRPGERPALRADSLRAKNQAQRAGASWILPAWGAVGTRAAGQPRLAQPRLPWHRMRFSLFVRQCVGTGRVRVCMHAAASTASAQFRPSLEASPV